MELTLSPKIIILSLYKIDKISIKIGKNNKKYYWIRAINFPNVKIMRENIVKTIKINYYSKLFTSIIHKSLSLVLKLIFNLKFEVNHQ